MPMDIMLAAKERMPSMTKVVARREVSEEVAVWARFKAAMFAGNGMRARSGGGLLGGRDDREDAGETDMLERRQHLGCWRGQLKLAVVLLHALSKGDDVANSEAGQHPAAGEVDNDNRRLF